MHGLDFADSACVKGKKERIASELRYCLAWQNLYLFCIEKINL